MVEEGKDKNKIIFSSKIMQEEKKTKERRKRKGKRWEWEANGSGANPELCILPRKVVTGSVCEETHMLAVTKENKSHIKRQKVGSGGGRKKTEKTAD